MSSEDVSQSFCYGVLYELIMDDDDDNNDI